VNTIGPYIILVKDDGTLDYFSIEDTLNAVFTKISGINKKISVAKKAISKKKQVAKNNKKLKKFKAIKTYWIDVILEVNGCALVPPLYSPPPPSFFGTIPISSYYLLDGGLIIADDGQYLGVFSSNQFIYESIANEFGTYGSDFGYTSIFNDFSTYGSDFSYLSPWNEFSFNPPIIYLGNTGVAYLTTNEFNTPRVDPYDLLFWLNRDR